MVGGRPPDVVNTTWYEDKKSLRTRRVIYQCLRRYRLVSWQLWKVCGPRGNWIGRVPVCEGRDPRRLRSGDLEKHLKLMSKNLKNGFRRFLRRKRPVSEQTGSIEP
ncbi:hypothetical protein NP493_25g07027 [Ridgeia piscesae]|uniref:Sushi domain-containing protein n=1 Tax=Ridgeia piscesae TaxID=27915 RepID=A0AAD9PDB3_RIDPI|nr:hypothetical protein NP493_25g07027 [Ridgeia piscesae]